MKIAQGIFVPGPPHILRGSFEVFRQRNLVSIVTSDDFYFDGSPAPGFALAIGTMFTESTARQTGIGRLKGSGSLDGKTIEIQGRQTMYVPPTLNSNNFDHLFLWCYKVPFLLGYGAIDRI